MVVSSAVCHLILNGDREVIAATILTVESFNFVVLALCKSRPIRLMLGGFTLDVIQEVVSPFDSVGPDCEFFHINTIGGYWISFIPRVGGVHENFAEIVTGDHEAIISGSGGFEPA